ncbi:MAG: acyltransferase [Sulfurimonas sp.]|jgi:acetyltransferase-like isoleucine patch superfamily enzyme
MVSGLNKIKNLFFVWLANKKFSNFFNNTFKISGQLRGKSKIRINGKNNIITMKNGKLKNIRIGINGDNNTVFIDENVQIGGLEIIIQNSYSQIIIGKNTEIGGAKIVCCEYQDKVYIGRNNLIADDVEFWSCDGHSIYQNGERINPSKPIVISDNVWIGRNVKILKGVTILSNTVIGMGSLVTARNYPANALIAGFPAKVIKEGITWSHERT